MPEADDLRTNGIWLKKNFLPTGGFTREFRRGGRYSPHWFDNDSVTIEPRWHDLSGLYSPFGDVPDLVAEGEDRYVIQNVGHEITLRFDAEAFPPLPEPWMQTVLSSSHGWLKDGDIHATTGDPVVLLPSRALSGYAPSEERARPASAETDLTEDLTHVVPSPEERPKSRRGPSASRGRHRHRPGRGLAGPPHRRLERRGRGADRVGTQAFRSDRPADREPIWRRNVTSGRLRRRPVRETATSTPPATALRSTGCLLSP